MASDELFEDAAAELEAFVNKRYVYMRSVSVLLFTMLGFFYGLSPLVVPVAHRFAGSSKTLTGGIFLYGFAIMFLQLDLLGALEIVVFARKPSLRKPVMLMSLVAYPFSVAMLAAAVHVISLPLFLLSFAVIGFPISVIGQYLLHAELSLVWGNEITKGNAIAGMAIGSGAFFWTLAIGELVNYFGEDSVGTVLAIVAAASILPIAATLISGAPAGEIPQAASMKKQHRDLALGRLMKDWRSHVFVAVINAFIFCGMSMKMLLSTIFEESLGLSYIEATRLSAICLLAYVPGRGLTPLLASKNRVFVIVASILAMESVAYALTPWAIALSNEKQSTWALIIYVILRLVSGGGFAMMLGNIGVLAVRVFGTDDVPGVIAYWSMLEWMVGIGPSVAWVMHVEHGQADEQSWESFNAFFHLCAVLASLAFLGVVALARWPRKAMPEVSSPYPALKAETNAKPTESFSRVKMLQEIPKADAELQETVIGLESKAPSIKLQL